LVCIFVVTPAYKHIILILTFSVMRQDKSIFTIPAVQTAFCAILEFSVWLSRIQHINWLIIYLVINWLPS